MSKTKAVQVQGRNAWVIDDAHDVVVARMIEAAERVGTIEPGKVARWREWASISDVGLHLFAAPGSEVHALVELLADVRQVTAEHGDVLASDVAGWRVLDGADVAGGRLRGDRVGVTALLEVVDAVEAMLVGSFDPDPPEGWWCLGIEGGRTALPMRTA